uniref:Uncharacterized protein n=1 Tax=Anopheles epiroticus TaxID=199890 RepID=A0A182PB96_9DIPT
MGFVQCVTSSGVSESGNNAHRTPVGANEKADLKSRSDSTSVPPLDSIYTTPTGFHHHHHHATHHPHHAAHHPLQNGTPGSPEAMKTPNSETDCGTVKESLTDDASTAGTGSPLQDGAAGCEGTDQPDPAGDGGAAVEEGDRCVCEDSSPPGTSSSTSSSSSAGLAARSHDRAQGQCAPHPVGTRLVTATGLDGAGGAPGNGPAPAKVRPPSAKASDYGLERFNRLLDRLDRGNFLIKTSFKKSYSLILMSARGGGPIGAGGEAGRVESGCSGNDSTASTNTGTVDSKTDGSGPVGCNSSSVSSNSSTGGGHPPTASFKRLQSGKGPGMGGSLRGWCPSRARGILIKANSSTGIYELAGTGSSPGSATVERSDDATTRSRTSTVECPSGQGKPGVPVPDPPPEIAPTNAASGYHYSGNSLAPEGENNHPASDELCRSEVYDNDSGSGSGGRAADQLLNNTHASPQKQPNVGPGRNNYENIRPAQSVVHRQRLASLDSASRTLGAGYRKSPGRKKSNAASTGSEWDEDQEHMLSSSVPHAGSEYFWQSGECAVPTRFFQRQDYAQPTLDFPLDRSTAREGAPANEQQRTAHKRTMGKKRWLGGSMKGSKNKALSTMPVVGSKDVPPELPFPMSSSTFGGNHNGSNTSDRKRPERVPQLKNINLHFPDKTSHQQLQHELRNSRAVPTGSIPPGAQFHQPTGSQQLSLPPTTEQAASHRQDRKYFSKAKSHFLKLGQKWRILTSVSGGKPRAANRAGHHPHHHHHQQQHISSYNLDDLIKATHRYGRENESTNLSQKIVYKSYKSELDLTKNLAYLDSFLNEHFEQEGQERTRQPRHKRAKSCSKAVDPSLKMVSDDDPGTDGTLNAIAVGTVPRGGFSNLIQLEDVWEVSGRPRGQHWVTATNTSSSSSEYLRNNFSTKANGNANKMRDFFRLDGTAEDALYGEMKDSKQDDGEEEEEEDEDEEEGNHDDDDDDDDARMLLFDSLASFPPGGPSDGVAVGSVSARPVGEALVEMHYGKNNATSSSLSSSDYASVYSATSSGGNGASGTTAPGKPSLHAPQFKLLATPEEPAAGDVAAAPKKRECSPKQQQRTAPSRMQLMGSNTTNPFVTLCGGGATAGHRIYNNFLDGSPRHQTTEQPVEKNHRRRKPQPAGRLPSAGTPVSPRGTDRYDYRVQPKPSNGGRSYFHNQQMVPPVLDTDLTYQEDYLEHYQNAARARTLLWGHNRDGEELYRHLHYRRPVGGRNGEETLQNNALANERSDSDSDDEDALLNSLAKGPGEQDENNDDDDGVVTTDELLLLVNAAIDIRQSHAVEQGPFLGGGRKKSSRRGELPLQRKLADEPTVSDSESGIAASENNTLLAYRSHAPYELPGNPLLSGEFRSGPVDGARRPFTGLSQTEQTGSGSNGGYLGYGPHRVIVSQSRKERGEVVLEYEC